MDGNALGRANFRRLQSLIERFRDKRYRDSYVASHNRGILARQLRNFRGQRSQEKFAAEIGKQKTVIARLENPAYSGWTLRTMLEIARKLDVAVIVRFVDFPTFLRYTEDYSERAMRPSAYDPAALDALGEQERRGQQESVLSALFSPPQQRGSSALEAAKSEARQEPSRPQKRRERGDNSPAVEPKQPTGDQRASLLSGMGKAA